MFEKKMGLKKQTTLVYFGVTLLVFLVAGALLADLAVANGAESPTVTPFATSTPTQPTEQTPAPPGSSVPSGNALLQVIGFIAVPIAAMAIVAFVLKKMVQGK